MSYKKVWRKEKDSKQKLSEAFEKIFTLVKLTKKSISESVTKNQQKFYLMSSLFSSKNNSK